MTVPLSATSPRRDAARRFGVELRRAMARRKVGQHRVAAAAQVASSAVANWKAGVSLPTLHVAIRLAEALEAPKLAEIVRDARMAICKIDGRPFLNEGGAPKLYCSPDCRDEAKRRNEGKLAGRHDAIQLLRGELLRVGPARKQSIGKALTLLDADKSTERIDRLAQHRDAITAMCRACEPLGYCRTEDCPLRPVSPLPLLVAEREADVATKAPGRWARQEARDAFSEQLRERWARPGARAEQSQRARSFWGRLTDEQREAHLEKTRAGIQRRDAKRREHSGATNHQGPQPALDEETIAELRQRHEQGWTIDALTKAYGVGRRTVYRYVAAGAAA